jgi:hypothetical protein
MSIFGDTGWRYYRLKNKKQLWFNSKGFFKCPVQEKLDKTSPYNDEKGHNSSIKTGDNHIEYDKSKEELLDNGDTKITNSRTIKKVLKGRKDLYCKCGLPMVFKGYPVYLEKIIKEGKNVSGLFTMGGESKKYPTRYFKNRPAQDKYIRKTLTEK